MKTTYARRPVWLLLAAILITGCGEGGTGPGSANLSGTYIGSYTATIAPGTIFEGVLQLAQLGSSVSGTLATDGGRSANVSTSRAGSRLTGSFTFTDSCGGTAAVTADIVGNADRITGTYQANDCNGLYPGAFDLARQR